MLMDQELSTDVKSILTTITAVCLVYICFAAIRWKFFSVRVVSSTKCDYIPSPKGLPFIGHDLQIPNDKQWLKFDSWYNQFGRRSMTSILSYGQPTLILNTADAAFDLLDSKGSIYSDRPYAIVAGELVGWDRGLGYAPYGERMKAFRRMFHQLMGPRPAVDLQHLQEKETARLLWKLVQDPNHFMDHARESTGATILMILYGYTAKPRNDPFVKIAEDAMKGFSKASEPGAFLVDRFPLLRWIPEWIPGGGFKRIAREMREELDRLYDEPFEYVKQQMAANIAIPSFTSRYLEENENITKEEEDFVKAASASLYSGGADTTPSSITSFILAMTLHPEIQAKAQAEVDAVLGRDRLPTFDDRPSMPYVNAVVKEIFRWNPAVPLGLPHELSQDDFYRGNRFQKGTVVWANIWTILHDPAVFEDPHEFRPERYLDDQGQLRPLDRQVDPSDLAFGFGRRICPGMHFADNSIFITIASILAIFEITKARDEMGEEITPEVEYSGFISHPKPFVCDIKPRSATAVELVGRVMEV